MSTDRPTSCWGFLVAVLLATLVPVAPVWSQPEMAGEVGEVAPLQIDSGVLVHRGDTMTVVFSDIIHQSDARWMRLFLEGTELAGDSFLRITSLRDGERQELGRRDLNDWKHGSAYFNGSTLVVELFAAPRSSNRLSITELAWDDLGRQRRGSCGYCEEDNRLPTENLAVCRLMGGSYSCSGTIIDADSNLITAGHCLSAGGALVAQFDVPDSNPDCSMNMPPVSDQFPVVGWICEVAGPGNDWAAVLIGQNGLGQRPYDRYGEAMTLTDSTPVEQDSVSVMGFGDDPEECERADTLQVSLGTVVDVENLLLTFEADVTYGNSGSPVLAGATTRVLGVTTHCPCPNVATRIDHPNFVAARNFLFNGVAGDTCETAIFAIEGDNPFSTSGAADSEFPDPDDSQCPDSYLDWDPSDSPDTWMVWQPPASGSLSLSTCDVTSYDTSLVVYEGTSCGALVQIACNGDAEASDDCQNFYSAVSDLAVSALSTYYVRISGWQGSSGNGVLRLDHVPTGDGGACCLETACHSTLQAECEAAGGVFQGGGSACGENPCGLLLAGACCSADGESCSVLVEADCILEDGHFLASASGCDSNPCGIPPPCPGDYDRDGLVDVDDLLSLLSGFGTVDETIDMDGNGIINVDDLLLLISGFGPCPPAG